MEYLSFSVWLISLRIMASKFHSCCPKWQYFLIFLRLNVHTHHIFLIFWSIDGHLDCFCILTIVTVAAMNMRELICLWDNGFVSFGCIPKSEISRLYGSSIFNFLRNLHNIFCNSWTSLHPRQLCTSYTLYLVESSLYQVQKVGVPFCLHSHWYLLSLAFLTVAILTVVSDISLWFWFAFPWWIVI